MFIFQFKLSWLYLNLLKPYNIGKVFLIMNIKTKEICLLFFENKEYWEFR